jgi:hypothetical protein
VGQHGDAKLLHDAPEDAALHDRAVVAVDGVRDALEWQAGLLRLGGLERSWGCGMTAMLWPGMVRGSSTVPVE